MGKDQLGEYAFSGKDFKPVKLDLRKSLDDLQSQVLALQNNVPEAKADAAKTDDIYIKNRETGQVFQYTDAIWNYLSDRCKCDKDGNDV